MSEVSLDLQTAVVQRLRNAASVAALVQGRVFDQPKAKTSYPYITYGSDQVIQDDVSCVTAYEISMQIDVWSIAQGQPQMKRIAGAVRAALHDAVFDLGNDHVLVLLEHETTRYIGDPDGETKHAAITFKALIDAAEAPEDALALWGDDSGVLELWGDHA